jgi:hypothetical protein
MSGEDFALARVAGLQNRGLSEKDAVKLVSAAIIHDGLVSVSRAINDAFSHLDVYINDHGTRVADSLDGVASAISTHE